LTLPAGWHAHICPLYLESDDQPSQVLSVAMGHSTKSLRSSPLRGAMH
jgi:hypothetical protein